MGNSICKCIYVDSDENHPCNKYKKTINQMRLIY